MKISFKPVHQFFNPLYCKEPPKHLKTVTTASVLFGLFTAGIPHGIYFTGKGIKFLWAHRKVSKEYWLEKIATKEKPTNYPLTISFYFFTFL